VDLCSVDPGFDVDLYVSTDLRTMTAIWMGLDTVRDARRAERLMLSGDRQLIRDSSHRRLESAGDSRRHGYCRPCHR
jgi:hypothetical protein